MLDRGRDLRCEKIADGSTLPNNDWIPYGSLVGRVDYRSVVDTVGRGRLIDHIADCVPVELVIDNRDAFVLVNADRHLITAPENAATVSQWPFSRISALNPRNFIEGRFGSEVNGYTGNQYWFEDERPRRLAEVAAMYPKVAKTLINENITCCDTDVTLVDLGDRGCSGADISWDDALYDREISREFIESIRNLVPVCRNMTSIFVPGNHDVEGLGRTLAEYLLFGVRPVCKDYVFENGRNLRLLFVVTDFFDPKYLFRIDSELTDIGDEELAGVLQENIFRQRKFVKEKIEGSDSADYDVILLGHDPGLLGRLHEIDLDNNRGSVYGRFRTFCSGRAIINWDESRVVAAVAGHTHFAMKRPVRGILKFPVRNFYGNTIPMYVCGSPSIGGCGWDRIILPTLVKIGVNGMGYEIGFARAGDTVSNEELRLIRGSGPI